MKNILLLSFLLLLVVISCNVIVVNAKEISYDNPITILRAGGGSSSGGHSSSGGSSSRHYGSRGYSSPLSTIISAIIFILILFASTIILYFKVLRASFNSKRYLRLLDNKDITWKYKTIEKRVIETFYVVEEA